MQLRQIIGSDSEYQYYFFFFSRSPSKTWISHISSNFIGFLARISFLFFFFLSGWGSVMRDWGDFIIARVRKDGMPPSMIAFSKIRQCNILSLWQHILQLQVFLETHTHTACIFPFPLYRLSLTLTWHIREGWTVLYSPHLEMWRNLPKATYPTHRTLFYMPVFSSFIFTNSSPELVEFWTFSSFAFNYVSKSDSLLSNSHDLLSLTFTFLKYHFTRSSVYIYSVL